MPLGSSAEGPGSTCVLPRVLLKGKEPLGPFQVRGDVQSDKSH